MWYWQIVFICIGTGEEISVTAKGYAEHELATKAMGRWLHNILPSLYLYKIQKMEAFYDKRGDSQ